MPILWRYLLGHYIKVLILCILSFIAILLVTRLDEIAHFAALGGQKYYVALFTLYQIPYILPISIPVSALISSMILSQKLSHSRELTAMRSCGISLGAFISPIILAGIVLSLVNFYITSEMATQSRLNSRKMIHDLTAVNPIVLLQNAKIAKLKGAYIQMETLRNGELAKDVIIAVNSSKAQRLNLFITKEMEIKDKQLKSRDVTLISSLASANPQQPDHLIIENQKETETLAPEFAHILRKSSSKVPNDHLKLNYLGIRIAELHQSWEEASTTKNASLIDHVKKNLSRCYSDFMRRISLGLSALSFTVMGAAFGIEISRRSTKKGILIVILVAAFSLVSFFIGKELDHRLILSAFLYFIPHALMLTLSFITLKRINLGIE